MHDDQIDVSTATAGRLVSEQFPQWAELPVTRVPSSGTVNAIFRIGDELAARFPLRAADPDRLAQELHAEKVAAARMAEVSPVVVPEVLGLGAPGHGYPLPWSVQTWVPGRVVTSTSHASSSDLAVDLADLVLALRAADTRGETFRGSGRGGRLADHDGWVATCLDESRGLLDAELLRGLWARYRDLPAAGADVMSHTDLIPANLVTDGRRLTGVLDAGGFGAADPALDLVCAWHLFDDAPRGRLRELLGSSDLEWDRGRAWAFQQALGALWYYLDTNPTMAELGAWTLYRIVGDETGEPGRLGTAGSRVWEVLSGGRT